LLQLLDFAAVDDWSGFVAFVKVLFLLSWAENGAVVS
jgi:hypothetical protein